MTITDYLVSTGLRLQDLAEATGISVSQLSRYRHGKAVPSWPNIKKIRDATNGLVIEFGQNARPPSETPRKAA